MFNGAVLGILAWAMHALIFNMLDESDARAYAIASIYTYVPLILLNFYIQRSLIFKSSGCLLRFLIANLSIMLLVSMMAPLCRLAIGALWTSKLGDEAGFIIAALLGATPSFVLSRYFVFRRSHLKDQHEALYRNSSL